VARVLRMPSEAELEPGTVRDFVELLFAVYRAADRPTLREISKAVEDGDYRGTASTETVRRMLRGDSVPRWETVEAVFEALCNLAGWDPDGQWKIDGNPGVGRTVMKRRWNRALDEPDYKYGPPPGQFAFNDEPPF
jgi:hypothetical protein